MAGQRSIRLTNMNQWTAIILSSISTGRNRPGGIEMASAECGRLKLHLQSAHYHCATSLSRPESPPPSAWGGVDGEIATPLACFAHMMRCYKPFASITQRHGGILLGINSRVEATCWRRPP